MTAGEPIEFSGIKAQMGHLTGLDKAIARVLDHGQFIMGPEVSQLERELATRAGVDHAITCSSGTDALLMILMALGIGPGHAVVVPAFSFSATAEVVALVGAIPVFADVLPDTFNLDPESAAAAVRVARDHATPSALIAVDLFGQPADYVALTGLCTAEGLTLIADAAQSFGASRYRRRVGSLASVTATSFFPSKPLGCYGDGGAVFTDDADLADTVRSLRVHGQGDDKYDNVRVGINGRLDTIQAAVLLEKLTIFDDELLERSSVAFRYRESLRRVTTPTIAEGAKTSWAQFTVRSPRRDEIRAHLTAAQIPSAIYYPTPLHWQRAYAFHPRAATSLPVSEDLAGTVLSLPMHAYLHAEQQDAVIRGANAAALS